jgi:diguanylate cyclase (GGDEF)-like protein
MDIAHISLHSPTLLLLVAGASAIAAAASVMAARLTSAIPLMQWARGIGAHAVAALVLLAPSAPYSHAMPVIAGVLLVYGLAVQATAIGGFFGRKSSAWIVGGSSALALVALTGLAARSPETLQGLATRGELLLALFAHAVGGSFAFLYFVMRRVRRLATRDALTGALNRVGFLEAAEAELSRSRRSRSGIATLVLDIDRFKRVNDRFGHAVGDKVLTACAAAMRRALRKEDVLARFGGDEFVVLLPATTGGVAADLADRLRRTVADATYRIAGREIEISASIGVFATTGCVAPSLATMLERADEALREAKQAGRNRVRIVEPGTPGSRSRHASSPPAGPERLPSAQAVPV